MTSAESYTAEEVDAAVEALADPDRYSHAQEVVTHAAPGLQRVLRAALVEGGWFDSAHDAQLSQAADADDPAERIDVMRALLEEETRLSMLVGVSVGFELARELAARRQDDDNPKEEQT
jgi:hypothetical protein